jgi:hypothetical protein
MPESHAAPEIHPVSPATSLLRLVTGNWVSQSVYVVAKLGIADLLREGPRTAEDLAELTKTHPDSLHRILRLLARVGVFTEHDGHRFELTAVGACLQTGVPGSLKAFSVAMGEELYRAWGDALHTASTGKSAFEHVFGMGPFEYRASRPEVAAVFNQAMTEMSVEAGKAILDAYDFSQFNQVADIGGGLFLIQLLQAHPHVGGVLFELPYVVSGATERINNAGLSNRCRVAAGDFFTDALPRGSDAYILKNVVDSFETPRMELLLKRIREMMTPKAKLLIIGWVIRRSNALALGDLLDTHFLVALRGRVRTEAEYEDLCLRSGLKIARIIPTTSTTGESILECAST